MTMTESRLQVALQSTSDLLAPGKSETAVFVDPKEALVSVLKESGIAPSVPMIAKLSQLALLLSTQKIVRKLFFRPLFKNKKVLSKCEGHKVWTP